MRKHKTGKSEGSHGRHIGATAPNMSRGHSRSIEDQQQAGSSGQHSQQQSANNQPQRQQGEYLGEFKDENANRRR
jgi:hypothetical protein